MGMIFFCAILECVAVVERVDVTAAAVLTEAWQAGWVMVR